MQTLMETHTGVQKDFLPLNGTDYVEFYVGNARQAAYYYRSAFGMRLAAYRGPETGTRDRASYVLVQQGKIRLVFTTPLRARASDRRAHAAARRWRAGYRAVGGRRANRLGARRRGAAPAACASPRPCTTSMAKCASPPSPLTATPFTPSWSARNYSGAFLPGFAPVEGDDTVARPVGLKYIDHMVGNVGWGEMNRWVDFYRDVMGFRLYQHFDDKDISTEYSALMSKVMANGNGRVKFPINEPAEGKRKSQIEEYLDFYRGPGVQHIAMATDNIIDTVDEAARPGRRVSARARALTTRI